MQAKRTEDDRITEREERYNRFKKFRIVRASQKFRAALQTEKNKVSLVQSAQTDVLYIACHSILQEYWGVAKLKPGRYSNPSPTFAGGDLISVLVANIPAAWAAYNRDPVQGCCKHTAHLHLPHSAVDCFSLTSQCLHTNRMND